MNKFRLALKFIAILSIPLCLFLLYQRLSHSENNENKMVVTNNMILEKVESIGKLELTKYYIKDIIEQEEVKDWYLPNSKVILIISGEIAGCIDLTKITKESISISEEQITIQLPEPEICYVKINHKESKVYDIQMELFDKAKLIDKAYAMAEENIRKGALKMGIIEQTKTNAKITLKPLLESLTNKKVEFI